MTQPSDDVLALADLLAIDLVAAAPDGHAKNLSMLLGPDGRRWVAPLYDLATGLTYDSSRVERTIALSIGGERRLSRIRRTQWDRSAAVLGLPPELLAGRAAQLATSFPAAFERACEEAHSVDGTKEVAERTLPAVRERCRLLLEQLAA